MCNNVQVVALASLFCDIFYHGWNPDFAILFVLQKGQSCVGELSFLKAHTRAAVQEKTVTFSIVEWMS